MGRRILINEVKTKRGSAAGFSLLEALMALTIVAIGVLSVAPVFVYSIRANAVGAELSGASALAVERMELLRSEHYALLDPGGDLDLDVMGYADDSNPDYIVRWQIALNASPVGTKTIRVRVTARYKIAGEEKQVEVALVRARG